MAPKLTRRTALKWAGLAAVGGLADLCLGSNASFSKELSLDPSLGTIVKQQIFPGKSLLVYIQDLHPFSDYQLGLYQQAFCPENPAHYVCDFWAYHKKAQVSTYYILKNIKEKQGLDSIFLEGFDGQVPGMSSLAGYFGKNTSSREKAIEALFNKDFAQLKLNPAEAIGRVGAGAFATVHFDQLYVSGVDDLKAYEECNVVEGKFVSQAYQPNPPADIEKIKAAYDELCDRRRSEIFVRKSIELMRQKNLKASALIAGGDHIATIENVLVSPEFCGTVSYAFIKPAGYPK